MKLRKECNDVIREMRVALTEIEEEIADDDVTHQLNFIEGRMSTLRILNEITKLDRSVMELDAALNELEEEYDDVAP